jgi:hypothetical protein
LAIQLAWRKIIFLLPFNFVKVLEVIIFLAARVRKALDTRTDFTHLAFRQARIMLLSRRAESLSNNFVFLGLDACARSTENTLQPSTPLR